jgi:hypothetical protein
MLAHAPTVRESGLSCNVPLCNHTESTPLPARVCPVTRETNQFTFLCMSQTRAIRLLLQLWRVDTGARWDYQPDQAGLEAATTVDGARSGIRALRFVRPSEVECPPSAVPAPLDTGLLRLDGTSDPAATYADVAGITPKHMTARCVCIFLRVVVHACLCVCACVCVCVCVCAYTLRLVSALAPLATR